MTIRHFIDLSVMDVDTLRHILRHAVILKKQCGKEDKTTLLAGKKLAMIFEKNSTRTRVSFEVGMLELGGHAIYLSGADMQLGRGETVADTAKVLSRYIDAIMLRCHSHDKLVDLAENSSVPVINGLTEFSHPCQIMADILTFEEKMGDIAGKTIAWVGDGNNMAQSWIHAAALFGFTLRLACPPQLAPLPAVLDWARDHGGDIEVVQDPKQAVGGVHAVITDSWVSMGDPDAQKKIDILKPFQVTSNLMEMAAPDAIFMHCLPAHRGEEVAEEVIDGVQSVVFDEAENRLHIQKAILLWCLGKI